MCSSFLRIALLILILKWVFDYVVTQRERLPNPKEDEIYEKLKKMLNGEKCGEIDVKTSRKINRLLLSKKYKVVLKDNPLTGKEEEVIVSIDFSNYYYQYFSSIFIKFIQLQLLHFKLFSF